MHIFVAHVSFSIIESVSKYLEMFNLIVPHVLFLQVTSAGRCRYKQELTQGYMFT